MADRYTPEKRREYMNTYRQARREDALFALGGKCVACYADVGLDFHHVEPKVKHLPIAKMWTASLDAFWGEVLKCELLCRKCHAKRHNSERQHGTTTMYRYGKCRCDPCRNAARRYWRNESRRRQGGKLLVRKTSIGSSTLPGESSPPNLGVGP